MYSSRSLELCAEGFVSWLKSVNPFGSDHIEHIQFDLEELCFILVSFSFDL